MSCATEMFATHRPEGVTVRALAAAAETSTGAVYTLFGGKDGLVAEVRGRAVAGLFQDLSTVAVSGDPLADLRALAAAYRGGPSPTATSTPCCSGVRSASTPRARWAPVTRSGRCSRRSTGPWRVRCSRANRR